jgi:hypothetical protein
MSDDVFPVTGHITNCATGETSETGHLLFPNDAEIHLNVLVTSVERHVHESNIEVILDCKGLDSVGFVEKIEVVFNPEDITKSDVLLKDLTVNGAFKISGQFCWHPDHAVTVYDPSYSGLSVPETKTVKKVISANEES